MIQTLTRNWTLLFTCGIVNAIISILYLRMWDTEGPLTFQSWHRTVVFLGQLALAAGACTITAALWRSKSGKCWLLVIHGLALSALGIIQYGLTGYRISLLTIALLIVAMAVSFGLLGLRLAANSRLLAIAGAASIGFALPFLALGFRWFEIPPGSHPDLLWFSAYFAFSALCMLAFALRLHRTRPHSPAM